MMRHALFLFAIIAGLFVCQGQARAALHVCNATDEPATVALTVLTQQSSGAEVRSIGWWQIDVGVCETIVGPDLDPSALYYLYAKSRTITWTGSPGKTSRDAGFCTNFAGGFNYVDRTNNLCTGAGQQMLWFINEPITGPDWTINLNVPQ